MQTRTPQKKFIIYVRTLQIMTYRLKNATEMKPAFINSSDIEKLFFPFPKYKRVDEVKKLEEQGLLIVNRGQRNLTYEVTQSGEFDLSLLQKREIPTDQLTQYIYNNLQKVSLAPDNESTDFFNLFLKYQKTAPYLFFTVDNFCGRIHTPISGLHRTIRPHLLIDNEKTVSIDITTAQPLILAKILLNEIGENNFSKWVNMGKDVYMMLLDKGGFENRDLAKKGFLRILFSPDIQFVERTFGKSNWTEWLKNYKSNPDLRNPKPKFENPNPHYNNVAWLLQSTEVAIMKQVWRKLAADNISFLSIHDSILIKRSDQQRAYDLFSEVMSKEFPKYYHLHTEELKESVTILNYLLPPELIAIQIEYSELDKNNLIKPHQRSKVADLFNTVGSCLRNEGVGLCEVINELIEYKKLIIKNLDN